MAEFIVKRRNIMNKYFLPLNHVCSLDRNFEIEQQSSDISVQTELNDME